MIRLFLAALFCACFAMPAEARKAKPVQCEPFDIMRPCGVFEVPSAAAPRVRLDRGPATAIGLDPRPRAWCGWFMQGDTAITSQATGLNLNIAREWAKIGRRADGPAVGVIVVWARGRGGHVGRIIGQNSTGEWIVRSGNDGGAVRERPRSVANAIAFRWVS